MAPRVTLTRIASAHQFGQQRYELAVVRALRERPEGLDVRQLVFTSLRSGLPSDRRLPLGVVNRLPGGAARAVGRIVNPRGLVHRLDLRLPPAPFEVVTVHDAAPLRYPDEGTIPRFLMSSVSRSVGAVCVSEFAAAEARDVFGVTRTWVAHNGVDQVFRDAAPASRALVAELCGAPVGRFVIHTGSASKRKNMGALADAWRAVQADDNDIALLLVGPPDERKRDLFQAIPGVHLLTGITTPVLAELVAAATVAVVPSLYEGFGLPAAEAMAAGTAVVAAARTSLPEVVGDAGLLVEPTPDGLAEGILRLLTDDELARTLGAAGVRRAESFTWERSAEVHRAAYVEALGG